ncbi:MAG: nickel-binding protein [Balneolaceae bacterium]
MPIFMDRHEVTGVTAEEVAEVHQEDLKIQHKHGCRALTYWFDEERGTAFCLIEAPDRKAVEEMHTDAHGLIPNKIVEVDSSLVEGFLGRIEDPEPSCSSGESNFLVFQDPGFRVLMVTEWKDAEIIVSKIGSETGYKFLSNGNRIIQHAAKQYNGREVKSACDHVVISFTSVTKAVECALEIQRKLEKYLAQTNGIKLQACIGLSAGEPVTEHPNFFGEAFQLARRLCYIADSRRIMLSSKVREQYQEENPGVLPEGKALSSMEEKFLNRLTDTTEKFWNQDDFNVSDFCRRIGVSKSQLYRKTRKLTGRTPNGFMKEYRLSRSVELLKTHPENIAKVAYEAGFNSPSYFSKSFKKQYGLLPSEYINNIR